MPKVDVTSDGRLLAVSPIGKRHQATAGEIRITAATVNGTPRFRLRKWTARFDDLGMIPGTCMTIRLSEVHPLIEALQAAAVALGLRPYTAPPTVPERTALT